MSRVLGAIERRSDGWYWLDNGERAANVRDLNISATYNFRCTSFDGATFVEVPIGIARENEDLAWIRDAARGYLRGPDVDAGLNRNRIAAGEKFGGDYYHRVSGRDAYYVPVEDWDAWAKGSVHGAEWDLEDQAAILARAEAFRAKGPTK